MEINCTRVSELVDASGKAIGDQLRRHDYGRYEVEVDGATYGYYSESFLGVIGRAYASLRMRGAFTSITDDDGICVTVSDVGEMRVRRIR